MLDEDVISNINKMSHVVFFFIKGINLWTYLLCPRFQNFSRPAVCPVPPKSRYRINLF